MNVMYLLFTWDSLDKFVNTMWVSLQERVNDARLIVTEFFFDVLGNIPKIFPLC